MSMIILTPIVREQIDSLADTQAAIAATVKIVVSIGSRGSARKESSRKGDLS